MFPDAMNRIKPVQHIQDRLVSIIQVSDPAASPFNPAYLDRLLHASSQNTYSHSLSQHMPAGATRTSR
jgi:hypothetical protein